ncbi:TPR repeat-containing protein YfgC precursor [Planctomycetes bacterium Poly30]|uniref:TPR repeat-containing protein YfgC n=1 Tax=Saltatorellus ferox TaxID=2528018 RepID=A0A518EXN4_9BACT|nr:TPR repeat-containing protein YfgC precursor [Planctomycetes bacterium Poly30]
MKFIASRFRVPAFRAPAFPTLAGVALALVGPAVLPSCGAISQLNLIPVSQDPVLGAEAYPQLLAEDQTIGSGAEYDMVVRMTDRLVLAAKELDPEIADLFEWEVVLVKRDDLVNAWCLPGGKMAVYTGILPVADDGTGNKETGLAVVMGHEIAHATLRHGTKAMTRQMGAQTIIALVGAALGGGDGAQLAVMAGSLAANLGSLTFGRDAELEADRRGLLYMATAGYDPRAAVAFWQRMQAASGGQAPPEWLSTHPSNENRIKQIQSLLPEAIPVYEQSRSSGGLKSFKPKG